MELRNLSTQDLDRITDLDRLCFPPDVAFPRETFEEALDSPACENFGFFQDRELAAFAVIYFPGPRVAQIITIDVHPDHRRQGLATALMTELEARSNQKGARRIYLQVSPSNQPALRLYQKWGYLIKATLPDYYGPGQAAHLMDKSLTAVG